MALAHAGDGCRVEAAAIVADGKEEPVAIEASGDPDGGGVAMPGGVDGEFPDDAEDRVRALVGEAFTRDAKIARPRRIICLQPRNIARPRKAVF